MRRLADRRQPLAGAHRAAHIAPLITGAKTWGIVVRPFPAAAWKILSLLRVYFHPAMLSTPIVRAAFELPRYVSSLFSPISPHSALIRPPSLCLPAVYAHIADNPSLARAYT